MKAGLLALLVVLLPAFAFGQGVLVDIRPDRDYRLPRPIIIWPPHRPPRPVQPPTAYKIRELAVDVKLQDQIAKVQVSQTFVNTGSRQMEVSFVFPLPYDGAIDQMNFMVDGKEYEAKLLNAKEARSIYEGYIRRNQDPALLEWLGTGMFKTSVFPVPPGAERKVSLRFSQVCRKTHGLTELVFPLSTAKYTSHAVEDVRINVALSSQAPIKNIYSPSHAVKIERRGAQHAVISYSSKNEIPSADFRLLYDIGDAEVAASAISYRPTKREEGYFMLLVSPEIKSKVKEQVRKTVVFVVDRSGSMSGKKIEQAREALKFVLNNLNPGDLFNIIAYDSAVESFRPELQRYDDKSRAAALGFVDGIYAGGSTNIDGALKSALSQLQDDQQPNYVVFLTDGLPTAGERSETKIVQNAEERNRVRARVFSMGVGYDVNSRLLDKLARTGFGKSEYVRPNEDIEEHVGRLYNRIGAPALTDVKIAIDVEGAERVTSRVYPKNLYDLFAGDQLVLVGRYKKAGNAKVVISGKVNGKNKKYDFPAKLVGKSHDSTNAFVEKLWAMRRVGEIIDEIDLHGNNQELVDEMIALATKHGIITPYTSYLADENSDYRDVEDNRRRANLSLEGLSEEAGRFAFEQRKAKSELQFGDRAQSSGFARNAPASAMQSGSAGGGRGVDRFAADGKEAEAAKVVRTVQNVGSKTFFLRDGRWLDSTLTAALEKEAVTVERYSKAYFDLITKHGREMAKYLAIEGKVVVVIDDQAYSF